MNQIDDSITLINLVIMSYILFLTFLKWMCCEKLRFGEEMLRESFMFLKAYFKLFSPIFQILFGIKYILKISHSLY